VEPRSLVRDRRLHHTTSGAPRGAELYAATPNFPEGYWEPPHAICGRFLDVKRVHQRRVTQTDCNVAHEELYTTRMFPVRERSRGIPIWLQSTRGQKAGFNALFDKVFGSVSSGRRP
jgi:hypothetical protein